MRLRKSSLLVAAAGALALTAAFVPVANAAKELQVYFNFNSEADKALPPYTSVPVGTYGGFPLQQTTLFSDPTTPFPGGQLVIDSAAGTTSNQFSLDGSGAGGALDVMGKANSSAGTKYCFDIGSFSTVGLTDLSLSFAIKAVTTAPGGAFTTLDLAYGTNGTTWTAFDTIAINQDGSFHIINDSLPTGTAGQSTFFLQFCFSGATNASGHVYVDNIQVAAVPEPSTYLGGLLGLLGVLGLCWYQRQCLVRGLSFRRA